MSACDDEAIGDAALDKIFRQARTLRKWQDRPVSPALLMAVYDLTRWGPTEANISPARFVFVVSPAAKARLEPLLDEGNRAHSRAAPATAIIGYDLDFARTLPILAPHAAAAIGERLAQAPEKVPVMAMRGAAMQGGYFIAAARALGLDCGPMSGFDRDGVDSEFLAGTAIRSYFLCNLGYGDRTGLRPRAPRLSFDEACKRFYERPSRPARKTIHSQRKSDHRQMKLLAVDTCLGACSAAVLQDGVAVAHDGREMARGHAEALAPMVAALLSAHDPASLDRLAVTVGPGTFTGQRVGLSFMRGLRLALDKPLIGLTSLETMALAAQEQTRRPKVAVLHDARRDEVYICLTAADAAPMPARVMAFAAALEAVRAFGPCALAGTSAPRAAQALGEDGFILSGVRQPDALFVARLAQTRAPPEQIPTALYLRSPDAKLPGVAPRLVGPDGDVAGLAALHAAAFDLPGDKSWDEASLTGLLVTPGAFVLAVNLNDRMAGFVLARAGGGEAEILTLAVAPSARGRGLGRALVRQAAIGARQAGAQALFLEVAATNQAALALYGALGFARVGTRKGYYGGRDAFLLKAALPLPGELA